MTQNLPPIGPPPSGPPPSGPPPGASPSPSFLDDSFDRLRASGLVRDPEARWFGGVCSGVARRLGVDPILIRAAAIILAFVGGIGLTLYVLLWLLMPDGRGEILAERGIRHGDLGAIALLVLAGLLIFGGIASVGSGDGWVAPLWLIPVAVVAWFVLKRRGTLDAPGDGSAGPGPVPPVPYGTQPLPPPSASVPYGTPPPAPVPVPHGAAQLPPAPSGETVSAPPTSPPYGGYRTPVPGPYAAPYGGRPTPPAPPRPIAPPPPPQPRRRRPSAFVGLVSLGVAMVGIGLGAALDDPTGFPGSAATLGLLLALAGVSIVVLTLGLTGRASGFSGFLAVVLALALMASSAASRIEPRDGVGDRTWTPTTSRGVTSYELGAGEATLDLRQLDSAASSPTPQRITVEMGAGELTILVPNGLDTRVDASVGFGDITHRGGIGGSTDVSGRDRSTSTVIGEQPVQVIVDAQLGLGQITIQEQ
ncbi:MAG TPA: PspC domain-containing protein [Actinotalea sp.]|nr:PspC domain-containing protein [Actinotalea sp.]